MRRGEENREKERKRKGGGRKERKGGRKEGVRWREGDGDLPPPPCVSVSLHPWAKGGRIKKEEGKKEKGRKERKRKERREEVFQILNAVLTELMFSWLRFALSISGVIGVGVPFARCSLYNTYRVQHTHTS